MDDIKTFRLDHFLGLNESADGATELKLGEASKMVNWEITPHRNIRVRPGAKLQKQVASGETLEKYVFGTMPISDNFGNDKPRPWAAYITTYPSGRDTIIKVEALGIPEYGPALTHVAMSTSMSKLYPIKLIPNKKGHLVVAGSYLDDPIMFQLGAGYVESVGDEVFYVPKILTGGDPKGGGTSLEPVNIMTPNAILEYSADGIESEFQLPEYVSSVEAAEVDNETVEFQYDEASHRISFRGSPPKGVNNVEIKAVVSLPELADARVKFLKMKYCEAYNGATDTRLFFYGDGTNVCMYTGTPAFGEGFYLPAGNEIAFDSTPSQITAMVTHYSDLIVFKPDAAYAVTYSPVTLADGTVIAGFYPRSARNGFGNEMDNQVQLVNNLPRTVSGGNLYEWKLNSSNYRDERNAKIISQRVMNTLRKANPDKIVTCDDSNGQTYYMFLNDDEGTVLVNNYLADTWCIFKGDVFKNVINAGYFNGSVTFANRTQVFSLDANTSQDELSTPAPIVADWESGYMAFGADYLRKYSSILYLSLLPDPALNLEVTASTDRRENYLVKVVTPPVIPGSAEPSPLREDTPKLKRVKLKIKKFTVYKLKLRVHEPDAKATVLGCDMQVRYSSYAK